MPAQMAISATELINNSTIHAPICGVHIAHDMTTAAVFFYLANLVLSVDHLYPSFSHNSLKSANDVPNCLAALFLTNSTEGNNFLNS
jgi:hypothetical protein